MMTLIFTYIPNGKDLFHFNGKLHIDDYVVKIHLLLKRKQKQIKDHIMRWFLSLKMFVVVRKMD